MQSVWGGAVHACGGGAAHLQLHQPSSARPEPLNPQIVQAFGAGQYTRVGVVLQRALLICSLAMLAVILLWTQLKRLLLLAGAHAVQAAVPAPLTCVEFGAVPQLPAPLNPT